MKRSSVFLVILLLVVVAAAVLSVKLFFGGSPAETEPPQQVHTPVPDETPAPEQTVSPSVEPETTPEPTAEPTEEPVFETRPPVTEEPQESDLPSGDISGSARSNTGTGLNLVANWSVSYPTGSETGTLTVRVSAESYSFFTSALYDAVELTVNGETYKAASTAVSYDGKDLITSPLAEFTVEVPRGNVSYSVTWHYKGSYSGVELEDISAAGSFSYHS